MNFIKKNRFKFVSICAVFFLILSAFLSIYLIKNARNGEEKDEMTSLYTADSTKTASTRSETEKSAVYVDLKGAVLHPGMYKIKEGMRLLDAVEEAGGFLPEADTKQVNYAQILKDQAVVYIPKQGETAESATATVQSANSREAKDSDERKVNINTADVSRLETLNGIGTKKAENIIAYREENGTFHSIEDLKEVSGIGDKIFDSLKDSITIK